MRKTETLALFLWLLAANWPVRAEQTLLQEVRTRMRSLQPFRVEFTQQVFIDGVKEAEENGNILFRDAAALKWEYSRPERKVFILLQERYQFYQPESRQLLRGRFDKQREKMLWQILAVDAPATGYLCDEKRRTISMRSETTDGAFDLVVFLGPDGLPARAEQIDPSGVKQVFRFRHYQGRLRVSAADFILTVPAETEIIDE